MKKISGNLSYRKFYAVQCIVKGATNSRSFDNCFEMGDSDEVVKYVMKYCSIATPENLAKADALMSEGVFTNSPEYKWCKKVHKAFKVVQNLKANKTWDYWSYFINNGSYDGFKAAA